MIRSVYVVKSETGPTKIGIATDVRHRFSSMKAGSPVPLTLAYAGDCEVEAAERIESLAHKLLKDKHHNGEWFSASVEEAVEAVLEAARVLGYEIRPSKALLAIKPRNAETGYPIQVRFQADQLAALDEWRRRQPDLPGRAEAMRRILTLEAEAAKKGRRK